MLEHKEFITQLLLSMAWLFWPLIFGLFFTLIYIGKAKNLRRIFFTVTFIGFGVYGLLRSFALGAEIFSDLISAFGVESSLVNQFLYMAVDDGGRVGMVVGALCTFLLSRFYVRKFLLLPGRVKSAAKRSTKSMFKSAAKSTTKSPVKKATKRVSKSKAAAKSKATRKAST